ncbi:MULTISPECIES: DUF3429 domain-containing protein [Ferrimonas]|uniref:DUF3429 domain-containing protein n=1 Tax=Ferrimonas TaxID=44011 RepID=UPI00041FDB8E|nr:MULTISPECIES: DUF3429 domain-containing protein [Ferrimonas]USD35785.1 DUF3429 domain-containing protein [Ferrimonas sp. SCSIO 43195]
MSRHALWLGIAGLIPFVTLPLLLMAGVIDSVQAQIGFVQYSAIILSFLGGIHWYQGLLAGSGNWQIHFSMWPSIVGWLALVLAPIPVALGVLALAFAVMMAADRWIGRQPPGYRTLRLSLTSVAVVSHGGMLVL